MSKEKKRKDMLSNKEYFKGDTGGMQYDDQVGDYFGCPFHKVIKENDIKWLIDRVKPVLNDTLKGEEYIKFNSIIDRLEVADMPDMEAIKEFEESASWGIVGDHSNWGNWNASANLSDIKDNYQHDRWYDKSIHTDSETGKRLKMDFDSVEKRILEVLKSKHAKDNNAPLEAIADDIDRFRDYWGNYPHFAGQITYTDLSYILWTSMKNIGNVLKSLSKKYGEKPDYKLGEKWLEKLSSDSLGLSILEDRVDQFIEEWNSSDHRDNDGNHVKLPTRPVKEEKDEDAETKS